MRFYNVMIIVRAPHEEYRQVGFVQMENETDDGALGGVIEVFDQFPKGETATLSKVSGRIEESEWQ